MFRATVCPLRVAMALAGMTLLSTAPVALAQGASSLRLTAAQWREDLRVLAAQLPRRHANAFHTATRADFERAVAALDSAIPRLDEDEVVVGLLRITAMIGDGHTGLHLPPGWKRYPLGFGWFGDELRVARAALGYERALGARVIRMGTEPTGAAFERMRSIIPQGETEGLVRFFAANNFANPNLLHGTGLAPSADSATFALEDSTGTEFDLVARPIARPTPADVATWKRPSARTPLAVSRPTENFWWTLLPDSTTVYVRFDRYPDSGEFKRLSNDLLAFIDRTRARRLVIDLRGNGGGDFTKVRRFLVPGLRERAPINTRGHFYVLIGPATFSAAMANATDFRKDLNAILVGEPTGARPNGYQENDEFRLPRSGLTVSYSTRYYKFQDDDTPGVLPDQVVRRTWDDYRAGRDPALEWVLSQR